MADQLIPIDFNQADIRIVIKAISELTGLNFLVDENVKGTVTLISPTKVRRGDAYKVLQSILETKGFATSPSGNLIKIMPRAEVNKRNLPYGIGNDPAAVPAERHPRHVDHSAHLRQRRRPERHHRAAPRRDRRGLRADQFAHGDRHLLEHPPRAGDRQELRRARRRTGNRRPSIEARRGRGPEPGDFAGSGETGPCGRARPAAARRGRGAPAPVSAAPAGGSKGGATIIPETRTNSLIVVASRPAHGQHRGTRRAARHGALAGHRQHSRRLPRKRRGQGHGQIARDGAADLDDAERRGGSKTEKRAHPGGREHQRADHRRLAGGLRGGRERHQAARHPARPGARRVAHRRGLRGPAAQHRRRMVHVRRRLAQRRDASSPAPSSAWRASWPPAP